MSDDPYESQTRANTSPKWLEDSVPVDVQIDGLMDFAKQTEVIRGNLKNHLGYLKPLVQLPNDAWNGPVLGEAAVAKSDMFNNYREFLQYTTFLQQALFNVGSAATAIANLFSSTDGMSASELAVKWAFGDPKSRPDGAPKDMPTWLSEYIKSLNDDKPDGVPAPQQWTDLGETHNPDGSVTQTAVNQDGKTMTITTWQEGGVNKVRTVMPDGTVTWATTTSSWGPANSRVETTVTTVDGKTTGTKTVTTTSTGVTTSEYNADGHLTSQETTTVSPDGSTTETDTSYDDKGNGTVTGQVTTGPETPGMKHPETPGKAAIDDIKANGAR